MSSKRVLTKEDFDNFRIDALDESPEWQNAYKSDDIQVFLKNMADSNITRVKTRGWFKNVSPETMYLVVMQDEYVRYYDTYMAEWTIVEEMDQSNDISYYASKLPSFISMFVSPRDFLSHRSYGQTGPDEYMLIMRSIEDDRVPPKTKWVRAHVHITGFLLRKHPSGVGTELIYMSQTDLKGKIPSKIVNYSTTKVAPSIVRQFEQDALKFDNWRVKHMKSPLRKIYPAFENVNFEAAS